MGVVVTGVVVGGNKIGRMLGFPTANLLVDSDLNVVNGVYTASVTVDGHLFNAVANIGYKPSVGSAGGRVLEVHIFDFDKTIYGWQISVELLDFIREERTFGSLEALRTQIEADKKIAEKQFLK